MPRIIARGQPLGRTKRAMIYPGAAASSAALFDPTSISGLQAWFDADDASTFTFSSGTIVSQWNDKSGNARHVSDSATANRRPDRSGSQNGRTTVIFDGVANILNRASVSVAQPLTFIVVAKYDNADTNDRYMLGWTSAGAHTSATWRLYCGTDLNSGVTDDGSWHCFAFVANGGSSVIYKDGSSIASGAAGATGMSSIQVGGYAPGSNHWDGEIAEVLIYNSVLSAGNLTTILGYSQTKWGTP